MAGYLAVITGAGFLQNMTFRGFNVFDNVENDWICSDKYIVNKYNRDPLCNYRFTTNGIFEFIWSYEKGVYKRNVFV